MTIRVHIDTAWHAEAPKQAEREKIVSLEKLAAWLLPF